MSADSPLARTMIALASSWRDQILRALADDTNARPLTLLYRSLRDRAPDLSLTAFADAGAQSLACSLVPAARSGLMELSWENLVAAIRSGGPFLTRFLEICRSNPVCDLSLVTDWNSLAEQLRCSTDGLEPAENALLSLYESLLRAMDPHAKRSRGVFHTPRPIAESMVRAVDRILREDFHLTDGLADTTSWARLHNRENISPIPEGMPAEAPFVRLLDVAAGGGTFICAVVDVVFETWSDKYRGNGKRPAEINLAWQEYVRRSLLPRLHGFEILLAPYTIAHLAIGLALARTGYHVGVSDTLNLYWANALERGPEPQPEVQTSFSPAGHRLPPRGGTPFTVLLGNPPYAIHSANLSPAARRLVDRYRRVEGRRIRERGALKAEVILQDDYCKFMALAQDYIEEAGAGVACLITNSNFIANPTLRGLRASLLDSYNRLYCLDLGGAARVRRPGDENVFDIETGVAVTLLGRVPSSTAVRKIGRLYGSRQDKLSVLSQTPMLDLVTVEMAPEGDLYLFRSAASRGDERWREQFRVDEIFRVRSIGIKTAHDHLVTDFDRDALERRMESLRDEAIRTHTLARELRIKDNTQWSFSRARQRFIETYSGKNYQLADFRPFDRRWIYYHPSLVFNPRPLVNRHVLGKQNICLLAMRRIRTESYRHFFVTRLITMGEMLSSADNCFVFPLYLYPPDDFLGGEQRPNLDPGFLSLFAERVGMRSINFGSGDLLSTFGPEDLLGYIYALFYAPSYRSLFAEQLRDDFPRVPLPLDVARFRRLARAGRELIALHLLESLPPGGIPVSLIGTGDHTIARGYPRYESNRVYLNASQYFCPIPREVWEFEIGSYPVCFKWLKDRRGRVLSEEEIGLYARIANTIGDTIRRMGEIDESLPDWASH